MEVDDVNLKSFDNEPIRPANAKSKDSCMPSSDSPTTEQTVQSAVKLLKKKEPPLDAIHIVTPFKLEVSASEDEIAENTESDEKPKASKKLILSSTNMKTHSFNNRLSLITKRSNKIPRRNSSDDFVLGFNEESGEVELLKEKNSNLKSRKKPLLDDKVTFKNKENSSDDTMSSPSSAKRMKKSSTPILPNLEKRVSLESPSTNSSKVLKTTENPITPAQTEYNTSHSEEKEALDVDNQKQHIVGDSEENNSNHLKLDYSKPFSYGWKRELVWRVNSAGKEKADIYFISPAGKKLRSRNEILPLLKGDLRIEDFSFAKEPLGLSAENELVRYAKPLPRTTQTTNTTPSNPSTPTMGKRVSKPKVPKGASPPPEGWTPTRALKLNNTALSSNSNKHSSVLTVTASSPASRGSTQSSGSHKSKKSRNSSYDLGNSTSSKNKISQLQTTNDVGSGIDETRGNSDIDSHLLAKESPLERRSTFNIQSTQPTAVDIKYPQTIAVVKGKKYVMVSKAIATSTTDSHDSIHSDLKQIKEGIKNIKKQTGQMQNESSLLTMNPISANNSSKLFATNFFGNISSGYCALICILKYLKIHERSRAASVCKLWNLAVKDSTFWQNVRMKNSKVCDWAGFASALRRGETKQLDLRKMLLPGSRSDDMWQDFCDQIGTVCTLEVIDMCRCSARVVENLFQTNKNLRVLNALAINDNSLDLKNIEQLKNLEELRLRPCDYGKLKSGLAPLQPLNTLKHLSLTGIRNLGTQGLDVLAELTGLQSLELGECGQFDSMFSNNVLPKLSQLQRLRLENNQSCCTLEILDAIANLTQLIQLELVNFDIKPGFDLKLCNCQNLQKLLIIPTYISQSATTNNIVLSAVQKVSKTLKVFTWGVTVELLRVTALYVDQCEGSTKKEKQLFDECIPVLKPVPGSTPMDDNDNDEKDDTKMDEDNEGNDVPQIEILPLNKVETILANNLPETRFTIVKIPYHATCKQQLVE